MLDLGELAKKSELGRFTTSSPTKRKMDLQVEWGRWGNCNKAVLLNWTPCLFIQALFAWCPLLLMQPFSTSKACLPKDLERALARDEVWLQKHQMFHSCYTWIAQLGSWWSAPEKVFFFGWGVERGGGEVNYCRFCAQRRVSLKEIKTNLLQIN